jgi:hypothetical protein
MFTSLFFLLPLLAGPISQPISKPDTRSASAPVAVQSIGPIHRGAPFELTQSVTLDDVMSKAKNYNETPVRIDGTVKSVCLKKGCWLILAGEGPTARARVTFKGYAFFAPMDSAGYKASVEGIVKAKVLSEAERAHLAEDGKVSIEEIPKAELRIVASAASFLKP